MTDYVFEKELRELRERLIECEAALANWGADSEYFLRWPERLTVDGGGQQ